MLPRFFLFASFLSAANGQNSFVNSAAGQIAMLVNTDATPTVNIFSVQLAGTDKLYVASDGTAYTTAEIATTSDRRLKEDINDIDGALQKINMMRGVSFRYKNNSSVSASKMSKIQLGFIAQEVQTVVPELVTQPSSGTNKEYLHMQYEGVTPLLVEAVKELTSYFEKEVRGLKEEITALRAEVEQLRVAR